MRGGIFDWCRTPDAAVAHRREKQSRSTSRIWGTFQAQLQGSRPGCLVHDEEFSESHAGERISILIANSPEHSLAYCRDERFDNVIAVAVIVFNIRWRH